MIFTTTQLTINGEPSALTKSGLIIDSEPTSHPFIIGSDSEYIINKARSWLESYGRKGFNNRLKIDCFYLFSATYQDLYTEHFYLLSFEDRNNPERCVIMKAIYDESTNDFEVDYFSLVARKSLTERVVDNVDFNIAVRAFFFSKTEMALSSFFEFTQHPDFEESVATFTLLNY
ncbi:hypothetical protein [Pseudomonas coronafaciens]|uniref:hypothetical protein n=1 Tax=Pseudomonas coronafaciens TaxID=53409 RepID=UPI0037A7FF12